ncbi:hypothetical protein O4H49_13935 [Kiloniella laminariae]|uniref:Uncharacterized protein n=1 Tax=Kiloniella laminariae TaxID=454162 RepID=A0ABT4LL99_9PROT|nr:hypothetical protein [Kiloniella laminariae]MCZ4281887.1 hypothetical protein [Kiloniella laminariae]
MIRTGFVRNKPSFNSRRTGLLGLTVILLSIIFLSTVSVSLAAILSPESFLAERVTISQSGDVTVVQKK